MYNQNKKRRKKYPTRTGRLTDDPRYFGVAKRKQAARALSPSNLARAKREKRIEMMLRHEGTKQPKLTGLQIRAIRITASRSTFPSFKRIRMWVVAQKEK